MPARGVRAFLVLLALVAGSPALAQPVGGGSAGQWSAAPCSGHGHTNIGRCFCDPGWSGATCGAPEKPLDCGAHGKASNGWCVCEPGWKGGACQTASLKCAHGKAAHGKCACEPSWSGDLCDKGP
jgi:hypothetical protein